jgi:hypothetical protein
VRIGEATALGLLGVALQLVVGAGCGPGHENEGPGDGRTASDSTPSCPASLAQTGATPCAREGLVCPISFDCEETFELVECTCKASSWSCRDPVGLLEPGSSPRCISPARAAEDPCPNAIDDAEGAACTDIGRTCFYEGASCPDGTTKLDDCACKRGASGSLVYVCVAPECSPAIEVKPSGEGAMLSKARP